MAKKTQLDLWDRTKPTKKHTTLTAASKANAKAAAKKAGRTYPNLVDNMRAAAEQKRRGSNKSA
jgi:hypothetical protein